jgi:hypothetical protein
MCNPGKYGDLFHVVLLFSILLFQHTKANLMPKKKKKKPKNHSWLNKQSDLKTGDAILSFRIWTSTSRDPNTTKWELEL